MSDEEEDYMSDAFLQKCGDTRPGLVPNHVAKAYTRAKKQKEADEKSKTKPKAVLEKEKREEGLGVAISSDNKGFSMLQKMGYKPGMVLGKSGTGRAEPVPVKLKLGRGGLGRETDLKRKQEAKTEKLKRITAKKQKLDIHRKESFLTRMNQKVTTQNVERDLYKSQKVCEQLDSQAGISEPAELFFWPEALRPQSASSTKQDEIDSNMDEGYSMFVQDDVEDSDSSDEDEDEESPKPSCLYTTEEQLEVLTLYLRNNHKYCIWCGTKYEDGNDLRSNCPGNTAEAHDD